VFLNSSNLASISYPEPVTVLVAVVYASPAFEYANANISDPVVCTMSTCAS